MSPPETNLYLAIWPSRVFPAHWAFFIPSPPSARENGPSENGSQPTSKIGTLLDVDGDPLHGFSHRIRESYDIGPELSPDGQAHFLHLSPLNVPTLNTTSNGASSTDGTNGASALSIPVLDYLKDIIFSIPPPQKSLRPTETREFHSLDEAAASGALDGRGVRRAQVRGGQSWVREVVDVLVEKGVLDEEAVGVVSGAPRQGERVEGA